MNEHLGVADLAKLVVMNVLFAELGDQVVVRLVGLLPNGFVHLHLQDQMRAALRVQPELDALE